MSSNNRKDQNSKTDHQGQDQGRDDTQPGQAGGDSIPPKEKTSRDNEVSDRGNKQTKK